MSTQERPKQTLSDRADTAKRAVTRTLRRVGFDPMLVAHGNAFDDSERRTIRAVEPYTMTSPERIDAVCQATRYIERAGIEGDVVECGVWRGGSMMAVARTLLEIGAPDRELYLYDTFAGMTEPSEMDTDRRGRTAMSQIKGLEPGGAGSEWCNASLPDVEINLRKTGYPMGKVHFVPGLVEETIPQTIPERIAFLRLDTDWYESTKHELEHLYAAPRARRRPHPRRLRALAGRPQGRRRVPGGERPPTAPQPRRLHGADGGDAGARRGEAPEPQPE